MVLDCGDLKGNEHVDDHVHETSIAVLLPLLSPLSSSSV